MAQHRSRRSPGAAKIGYLGGVLGVIIGVLYLLFAGVSTIIHLFHEVPVGSFVAGVLGIIFGIVSIAFAETARKDSALGGVLLIIGSILGFYFVGGVYVISSVIVLLAGIVAIVEYIR